MSLIKLNKIKENKIKKNYVIIFKGFMKTIKIA